MTRKLKILFLCTGNSCRSQMAEGWTRQLKSDQIDVCSAGIEKHGLKPLAVRHKVRGYTREGVYPIAVRLSQKLLNSDEILTRKPTS